MRLTLLGLAATVSSSLHAESYHCLPIKRTNVSIEGSKSMELSQADASKNATVIDTNGTKYVWSSRENTPMFKSLSGQFTIFHAENGSGLVKISSVAINSDKPKQYPYFEMLSLGLGVILYNGLCTID